MLQDAVPLAELSRALVVKLRHHGDVLLASPVFGALKAQAPKIEIDALTYDDTAPMLAGHPAIAQLHAVGRGWKEKDVFSRVFLETGLFNALRARQYDLIVHLSEHPRGAWLARTLGARYSVAPAMPDRGDFWKHSFTHLYPLPKNGRRHQVELNLDALRRIGVQPGLHERKVLFIPGEPAERKISELVGKKPFIHFHPASRWRFKCWPAENNAELVDRLSQRYEVVLTASPDADEISMIGKILESARTKPLDLAGKLSIKELGALAARARLFVGVDSMPMHLAAAMGTPTVALFGPSGEHEWGPWNVAHRVVTSAHACRPCGNDGCGGGKVSECLTKLEVDRVHAACEELLRGEGARG